MQKLVQKIKEKITVDYCKLSIVSNPDGLLWNADVQNLLQKNYDIEVVCGSQLQLRTHFELVYKKHKTDTKFVYLAPDISHILPDMANESFVCQFTASDLFPLFSDKSLLNSQPADVLAELINTMPLRKIPMSECRLMVDKIKKDVEERRHRSVEHFRNLLLHSSTEWDKGAETYSLISDIIEKAVRTGAYEHLSPEFSAINNSFQVWLDEHYFALQNSSPVIRPYCVSKILPHLVEKYGQSQKVSLVVVDGLALWQWSILRDYLHEKGIKTDDSITMAWIPTITMLSRQAIFRGANPRPDYNQNPASEKKLWTDFWRERGFNYFQLQYLSDADEFAINEGVTRLAYVTSEMDEKMHACKDLKDLHSLTENWCPRIYDKIATMKSLGYVVYLTSDHGSTDAFGKRSLTSVEKVFLYKDGSRGKRHLIYHHAGEIEKMYESLSSIMDILKHDNWMAIRDNSALIREGDQIVTHGGCNIKEVVVPFIKI